MSYFSWLSLSPLLIVPTSKAYFTRVCSTAAAQIVVSKGDVTHTVAAQLVQQWTVAKYKSHRFGLEIMSFLRCRQRLPGYSRVFVPTLRAGTCSRQVRSPAFQSRWTMSPSFVGWHENGVRVLKIVLLQFSWGLQVQSHCRSLPCYDRQSK